MTFEDIARQLCLPPDEVQALIMGLLTSKKPEQVAGNRPDIRKVFAIWSSLRDHLECRGSRAGLRAFVERQVGVSDPNFLNGAQARQVVEALKSIQKRHGIEWAGKR